MKSPLKFLILCLILSLGLTWIIIGSRPYLSPERSRSVVLDTKKDENTEMPLKEALFYQKSDNNKVWCQLCFRKCTIAEGKRGFCRTRENRRGTLYSLVYAKPCAVHIDPVEKEPQFHMLPGSEILCLATAGCNFRCRGCHNWHISQAQVEELHYDELTPNDVIKIALERKIPTISFTYSEPITFYEYVYDIAKLARQNGIKILIHSNGSLNPEPLKELLKYTDAITVDLKGFTKEFYKKYSSGDLDTVLKSLKIIKECGVWLEIVNLIIPTFNDNPDDIRNMCNWIRDNLGAETVLHFTRFTPAYKLTDLSSTPVKTLEQARKIAIEAGLKYVIIGNVPGHKYNSTFCPNCGEKIIHRIHFSVLSNEVKKGKCSFCNHKIPGIWQ